MTQLGTLILGETSIRFDLRAEDEFHYGGIIVGDNTYRVVFTSHGWTFKPDAPSLFDLIEPLPPYTVFVVRDAGLPEGSRGGLWVRTKNGGVQPIPMTTATWDSTEIPREWRKLTDHAVDVLYLGSQR